MALPIIKAKSYNYGSYANPQQVKFRAGIGAQIGEQFGAGLAQGMQEKRAEKKEQKRLEGLKEIQKAKDRLAAENKFIEENSQNYYEVYGKENAYSFSEFMNDNITYDGDSVDMKFNKKINRENLLSVGSSINALENDGVDYNDPNLLNGLSRVDFQNASDKHKIKNGALITRPDKSTNPPGMKYFLPDLVGEGTEASPKRLQEREVDIMAIFNHKNKSKYNDNVLADKKYGLANEDRLKELPLEYVKQDIKMSSDGVNGRLYEVIDVDKISNDPDINFEPGINAVIDDYGESIWVDKMGNSIGSYTGSEKQNNLIREELTQDVKKKIGDFRLSSTKYTRPKDEDGLNVGQVEDIYKNFENPSGIKSLLEDIKYGGRDILKVEIPKKISFLTGGSNIIKLKVEQSKSGGTSNTKPVSIDLNNKTEFRKLLVQTNGFGNGKEFIDAIMAKYDNYIK